MICYLVYCCPSSNYYGLWILLFWDGNAQHKKKLTVEEDFTFPWRPLRGLGCKLGLSVVQLLFQHGIFLLGVLQELLCVDVTVGLRLQLPLQVQDMNLQAQGSSVCNHSQMAQRPSVALHVSYGEEHAALWQKHLGLYFLPNKHSTFTLTSWFLVRECLCSTSLSSFFFSWDISRSSFSIWLLSLCFVSVSDLSSIPWKTSTTHFVYNISQ